MQIIISIKVYSLIFSPISETKIALHVKWKSKTKEKFWCNHLASWYTLQNLFHYIIIWPLIVKGRQYKNPITHNLDQ